ncbi:MAG: monovalent cation/H+ antiporter subunit A [Burkholderiaceae bacterium]|jgi:multicomponent K+:H+ antiporter subunit A|nr:monovalent cation/H+ antiporter subunit A [Burkholderiaceae bacterium]
MPDLLIPLLLPFAGSALAALLPSNARNREAWLAAAVALAGIVALAARYPEIAAGEVLRHEIEWLPGLGLAFVVRVDGFAWMFAMLVLVIGLLVVVYARYYMSPSDPVPRFFSFFLAFMGSMLGVVLSGNLIQLAMFWELTSLVSFLLIGYWHHRADARRGARMALAITVAGGLCLFVGVLMLGQVVGSYDLDRVLASGNIVREHDWYRPILVLVALGALTKSAQFPFHFWLPRAMAAPTPVSAFLHSATMVKAGVFLLARLWPVLAGTPEWSWIVGGAGLSTLLLGAFVAIFQHDLKGLLAYSTLSHLGLITLLLGIGTPLAAIAAIFHTMNHATFKASLFMAAGIVDHETGTRDMRRLSGLYRVMPITATLATVAAAAMAGVPLLNGFLSKEMFFYEAAQAGSPRDYRLAFAATVAGMFSVAYSLRFIHEVFFGAPPHELPKTPHEPPRWMRFPIEMLVLACLVVGVAPALTVGPFLDVAARSVLGDATPQYSLSIWHGLNLPVLMSVIALAGGTALYLLLQRHLRIGSVERVPFVHRLDGQRLFERFLDGIGVWATRLEGLLGTVRLQPQLGILIVVAVVAGAAPLAAGGRLRGDAPLTAVDPVFALLWAVGIACAVGAAWQAKYHRLMALALMGGAGLVTSLTFVWLSAPDLALTQLMVETVTTVLILLGLRWLPPRLEARGAGQRPSLRDRARRARDLVLALAAGSGVAALAWAIMTRPFPQGMAPFYLSRSLSEGGGANVVNVLLVDFRGFDTMGEITVLGIVAVSVYALLRRFRPDPESIALPVQQSAEPAPTGEAARPGADAAHGYLMVPAVFVRTLFPIMTVVSIFFFIRGHNEPGGGFVAGLIMAVAIILQYMVGGTIWVEEHLRLFPRRLVAIGLLVAATTGAGSWYFGYPFLTSHSAHPQLPLLGVVPMPSAFLFDLGVYVLVVGATAVILLALAHQSVRSHRAAQMAAGSATPGASAAASFAALGQGGPRQWS